MQPWSSQPNYSSGPDTGHPTKVPPAYTTFTDGVGVAAQEMNALMNTRDNLIVDALAGGMNWTPKITAASIGSFTATAITCANYNEVVGVLPAINYWTVGVGDGSGSGNTSLYASYGLGDADFVNVSSGFISGGLIREAAYNTATGDFLAIFQNSGGSGAIYKCTSGGAWVSLTSIATAFVGRPHIRYFNGQIAAVFITAGFVTCAVSTDNGATFGNGFTAATTTTDVAFTDNGTFGMVMAFDGNYWVGSLASWTHFSNPFPAGHAVVDVTWSTEMGGWFATTFDGSHTFVWKSADNVGWTQQSNPLPFVTFGIAAGGPCLCMADGLSGVANMTYFSPDEGVTWYPGSATTDSPSTPSVPVKPWGSRIGFVNAGQNSLRFSRRVGRPLASF